MGSYFSIDIFKVIKQVIDKIVVNMKTFINTHLGNHSIVRKRRKENKEGSVCSNLPAVRGLECNTEKAGRSNLLSVLEVSRLAFTIK